MIGTGSRASAWLNWAQQPREAGGLGLAPHQAAGIVGNLVHESGQDLSPWGPTGDNGSAWGTAQWRGDRLSRLKAMPNYQSMETQQAFMRQELDGSENKAYRALQSAQSPEEAARAWDALYERSDGSTRAQRTASARQLMDQFGGGGAPDTGGALSFAPTNNSKSSMPSPALSADDALGSGALNMAEKPDNVYDGLMQMAASLASISNPQQAQALTAQMNAGRKQQGSWSHQIMPNGQIMMSNTNGQTRIVGKPGDYSKDDTFQVIKGVDPTTGLPTERVFNKNSGEFTDGQGQGASAPQGLPATLDELKQINPSLAAQAEGVNEGRIPYPNASRLNPQQTALKNAVSQYFPGVDATTFKGREAYMKNLGTAQPSQPGGQYVGLGHSLDMLRQLSEKYVGLGNSDYGYGIGHALNQDGTGMFGDKLMSNDRGAKVNSLNENADRLATEIGRLFSGNQGGGVHEREQTRERVSANKTPTEAGETLKSIRDMILSRRDELLSQADALGIPHARIPGLEKLEKNITDLNGNIDVLKGKSKAAAPAAPALPKGVKSIQVIQ